MAFGTVSAGLASQRNARLLRRSRRVAGRGRGRNQARVPAAGPPLSPGHLRRRSRRGVPGSVSRVRSARAIRRGGDSYDAGLAARMRRAPDAPSGWPTKSPSIFRRCRACSIGCGTRFSAPSRRLTCRRKSSLTPREAFCGAYRAARRARCGGTCLPVRWSGRDLERVVPDVRRHRRDAHARMRCTCACRPGFVKARASASASRRRARRRPSSKFASASADRRAFRPRIR